MSKIFAAFLITATSVSTVNAQDAFFRWRGGPGDGQGGVVVPDPDDDRTELLLSQSGNPEVRAGQPITYVFSANGGVKPYVWSLSGDMPNGFSFNNGAFGGAPTTTGAYPVNVTVEDGVDSKSGDVLFSVYPAFSIVDQNDILARVGTQATRSFPLVGDLGNTTWQVSAGSLPEGLAFSDGTISGIPTETFSGSITLSATDGFDSSSDSTTLDINVAESLQISGGGSLNVRVGDSITPITFNSSGVLGEGTWISNTLPLGLTFSENSPLPGSGEISGLAVEEGAGSISISLSDNYDGSTASTSVPFVFMGLPIVTTESIYEIGYGTKSTITPLAENILDEAPIWSISEGTLPEWAAFNPDTGKISGVPNAVGDSGQYRVLVTDGDGKTGESGGFIISVVDDLVISGVPGELKLRTGAEPEDLEGWFKAVASGAAGNVSWTLTSSGLPGGSTLSINEDGSVSGTIAAAGSYSVNVVATETEDGETVSNTASKSISVTVVDPLSVAALPESFYLFDFDETVSVSAPSVSNAMGSVTWMIGQGKLPEGLSVGRSDGSISGTTSQPTSEIDICILATDSWDGFTSCSPVFTMAVTTPAVDLEYVEFPDTVGAELDDATKSEYIAIKPIPFDVVASISGDGAPLIRYSTGGTFNTFSSSQILPRNEHIVIQAMLTSSSDSLSTRTAQVTIHDRTVPWNVTTRDFDNIPDPFPMNRGDYSAVDPYDTVRYSSYVVLDGFDGELPLSVLGDGDPAVMIEGSGEGWVTSATVSAGDRFLIQQNSPSTTNTERVASVTVGSVTETWQIATSDFDASPEFVLVNVTDVEPGSLVFYPSFVTPQGYDVPLTLEVSSGPAVFKPSGSSKWLKSYEMSPRKGFLPRVQASVNPEETVTSEFRMGETTVAWNVTTRVTDNEPDLLNPPNITDATPGDTYYRILSPGGFDGTIALSVSGAFAQVSLDNSTWFDSVDVNQDTSRVYIRGVAGNTFGETVSVNLNFGPNTETWTITTKEPTTNAVYTISSVSGVATEELVTSASFDVTGDFNTLPASISGDGNPEFSLDGGASWMTSGDVSRNDAILIRLTAADVYETTSTAAFNVGSVSRNFFVTTAQPPYFQSMSDRSLLELSTLTEEPGGVVIQRFTNSLIGQALSVSGAGNPEVSTDGGVTWASSAPITGTTFMLRAMSADEYGTASIVYVQLPGITPKEWRLTTRDEDVIPAIPTVTWSNNDYTPGRLLISNVLTATDYDGSLPLEVYGEGSPEFSVDGGITWQTSGIELAAGDEYLIRATLSSEYSSIITFTVKIGAYSKNTVAGTRSQDTAPTGVTLSDVTVGQAHQWNVQTFTVYNFDGPLTASIYDNDAATSDPGISNDGGATWASSVDLNPGDEVSVRCAFVAINQTNRCYFSMGSVSKNYYVRANAD